MTVPARIITDEGGRDLEIPRAASLSDGLAAAGIPLNTRCGNRGLCRGCEVELRKGSASDLSGKTIASPALLRACQVSVREPVEIRIPARSRMEHKPQVSDTFRIEMSYAHQPVFCADKGKADIGFSIDIGTTTVAVLLIDLVSGDILSRASGFNAQIRYGDNVLTRIEASSRSPGALKEMQRAVVQETIEPLLIRACERAGRNPANLAGGTVSGNTTMLHLLTAEDPSSMGALPFTPRFIESRRVTAAEIGLFNSDSGDRPEGECPLLLLPGIAAYIGADIVAGVWTTGMCYDTEPSLLIDIGTNGEIVLQKDGALFACATAAGPAFEGSGLRCGSRAREGAISDISIDRESLQISAGAIGEIPAEHATGICGSAYVDFLSEGRMSGILRPMGRFDGAIWERLKPVQRIEAEGERLLRIAGGQFISEVDVALLLQAKAAVGAGIETLLDRAGIAADRLSSVYLAGGFGMHLNVSRAIQIGLLPGISHEQVRVVGNTSLAGATVALLDKTALAEMDAVRSRVEVVELNLVDEFEERFIDHLMLP